MKFAVLGLGIFPFFASAAVPLYYQCGGEGWTGETDCVDGAVCQVMNTYYSQCVTNPTPTTTVANPTSSAGASVYTGGVALYGQCGGSNYTGDTGCVSTAICKHWNPYYYQCVAPTIPAGAITVGQNGEGTYTTISQALNDTSSNVIYVYPGNYTEQVVISRPNITIYGQTSDKLSYYSNMVTVSGNKYAGGAGSNDLSGTVRITTTGTGASLFNLNIENTFGKPIDQAQAIALSVQAGPFACYACQLRGYQDTLLSNRGAQFYGKSLIQGSVDFIFGQYGSVWITGGTINTVGTGYVTASGRLSNDSTWYVIDKTTVTGTGQVYLGRPWRNYARVVFQNDYLDSNIVPAGWKNWSDTDPRTDKILFGEYNNTGPGAWNATARPSFATLLTAPVDIITVLNSTSWIDPAYL
ncbi:hypothetical protein FRB90_002648 [Tulasnella sp. 427]|nr:hypothetical protein FRB90_002648 [Tulasnella sp. 427]